MLYFDLNYGNYLFFLWYHVANGPESRMSMRIRFLKSGCLKIFHSKLDKIRSTHLLRDDRVPKIKLCYLTKEIWKPETALIKKPLNLGQLGLTARGTKRFLNSCANDLRNCSVFFVLADGVLGSSGSPLLVNVAWTLNTRRAEVTPLRTFQSTAS